MEHRGLPFDASRSGPEVVWPPFTGLPASPRRWERPAELWELDFEMFEGEQVLEDAAETAADQLIRLARYLTVRIATHAAHGGWTTFSAKTEREAALAYLAAAPANWPERRWLHAALASISDAGALTASTVSRLSAAAAMAADQGQRHGSFALYRIAYTIAARRGWHRHAARVARAIAVAAASGNGARSVRLWTRRARVHEHRAA
jgi:hypothetical protein